MAIKLSLLFTMLSILCFSCEKNDFPLPQKLCQIKTINRLGGPALTGTFEYIYNGQRHLAQLNHPFAFQENLLFEYDNHERPVIIKEGNLVINKLIYENGLVVRIDRFDGNDNMIDQAFFTYDNDLRLIERKGFTTDYSLTRYEYEGQSTNPKRKLLYGSPIPTPGNKETGGAMPGEIPPGLELQVIYEYTYDHKINPQATLVGQPLSPFYYGQDAPTPVDMFEPIPKNNVVYQKFMVKSGDAFFNYQEYFITYEYDDLYPVRETHRKVLHNLDQSVPPIESFGTATYTYECTDGN